MLQIIDSVIERFIRWTKVKIRVHFSQKTFNFSERQIWWAGVGQNVGVEQNGKNDSFERPVLIFKKFNNEQFWSLPISTKIKANKYNYIFIKDGREFCLSLSQLRVMDRKRLLRYVGDLSADNFAAVKAKIKNFLE